MKHLNQAKTESIKSRFCEICGLFVDKNGEIELKLLQNKHPDPSKYFAIDPVDFLKTKKEGKVLAVFHSHLREDCGASDFDMINSENCCLPFVIYSVPQDKFGVFVPKICQTSEEDISKLL